MYLLIYNIDDFCTLKCILTVTDYVSRVLSLCRIWTCCIAHYTLRKTLIKLKEQTPLKQWVIVIYMLNLFWYLLKGKYSVNEYIILWSSVKAKKAYIVFRNRFLYGFTLVYIYIYIYICFLLLFFCSFVFLRLHYILFFYVYIMKIYTLNKTPGLQGK